jgi:hypothetical protein
MKATNVSHILFAVATALILTLVATAPAFGHAPDPGPRPHLPTIAELTPALIAAITTGLLSLAFRFVPRLRLWFDEHTPETKQSFMLIATFVVGLILGMAAIARYGFSEEGLILLGVTIYAALSSNQVTYQFIKPHGDPTAL